MSATAFGVDEEQEELLPEPLFVTPRKYPWTRGNEIYELTDEFMYIPRGEGGTGGKFVMTRWQKETCEWLFEENDQGLLRYKTAIIGIPRKNGKSLLAAAIALYCLLYGDVGTQIYSAGRTKSQARIVFDEVGRQINANKDLRAILQVQQYIIRNRQTGATYQPLAADGDTAQGLGPEIVICDEVHTLLGRRGRNLWDALTQGSADRAERLVIGISTAGENFDTLFGELYQEGVKICSGFYEDNGKEANETFGFRWYGAKDGEPLDSPRTWYRANPNMCDGLIDVETIRDEYNTAVGQGNLAAFKRYKLNLWTRTDGQEEFLTPAMWSRAAHPHKKRINKGERIFVGFDGSLKGDASGFLAITEEGFIELLAGWENTGADGWEVPRDEVNAELHRIFKDYDVVALWADATKFETDVLEWSRTYGADRVVNIPQSYTRLHPMTQDFRSDFAQGELSHASNPRLQAHFLNAIEDHKGLVKKDHPKSKRKIDFLVCAIHANGARNKDRLAFEPAEEYEESFF